MRFAARSDENQPEIVQALRATGAAVTSLHRVGHGVSDLLVSFRQQWHVFEVKNPDKPAADQELTLEQKKWIGLQRAPVIVVYRAFEAVDWLRRQRP